MIRGFATGILILGSLALFATSRTAAAAGYEQLVIRRSANETVQQAARDLADIIQKTTGKQPVIRWRRLVEFQGTIIIGAAPLHPAFDDDPLTDEILVERTDAGIEISGSDNTATGLAVYRFIERFLGWRYYQPGELGLERLDNPPPLPSIKGENGILLLEKAGFYSRSLSGTTTRQPGINWSMWNGLREKFAYNHQLHRIITPDQFTRQPGWFAKRDGGAPKRPPYSKVDGENDHPDLSSAGVRQAVLADFINAHADTLSGKDIVSHSLSLADSFEFGWYPDAYRWKPDRYFRRWPDWSNHVFDYTNAVAEQISSYWDSQYPDPAKRPPLYLGALAYLSWERAPDFAVNPVIVPYLTFDRSQWYDPIARRNDLENVESWARKDTAVLGTWDYLFGYGFLVPRSLTGIVSSSIPALHQRGVRAYFSQVEPVWPFDLHTTWLASRLLWHPGADPDTLLEEFFHEYYGPAGVAMKRFFQIAESIWMGQDARAGGDATGESTGWWLRYWKDPWQVALWQRADIEKMQSLLERALQLVTGSNGERFHRRIRQTADLFAATRTFYDYQHALWGLCSGNFEQFSGEPLRLMESLERQLSQVIRDNPNAAHVHDLSWVNRYDSSGAEYFMTAGQSQAAGQQLAEWCNRQGYTAIPSLVEPPTAIRLPGFGTLGSAARWQLSLLDSENAVIAPVQSGRDLIAESVRRGHVYQGFMTTESDFCLAQVDVATAQSPSAEIYIRIDFFDAANGLIGSSNRARLAPTGQYGEQQTLSVLAQAPASATAARLVIRFYEMDRGSRAIVTNPRLIQIRPDPIP